MDVTPLVPEGRQIIQGYHADSFRVSGTSYEGAVIVTPTKTTIWSAPSFNELSEKDFDSLLAQADEIDVVLIGTGAKGEFFPPKLRAVLREKGLVVDVMDTGAACRTYNVLMAEGRRIAAALLPVK